MWVFWSSIRYVRLALFAHEVIMMLNIKFWQKYSFFSHVSHVWFAYELLYALKDEKGVHTNVPISVLCTNIRNFMLIYTPHMIIMRLNINSDKKLTILFILLTSTVFIWSVWTFPTTKIMSMLMFLCPFCDWGQEISPQKSVYKMFYTFTVFELSSFLTSILLKHTKHLVTSKELKLTGLTVSLLYILLVKIKRMVDGHLSICRLLIKKGWLVFS